jgi:two-component system response regulator
VPNSRSLRILVVEDSPTDRLIAEQAFKLVSVPVTLEFAEDGEQAMGLLRTGARDPGWERPHLILLDLNMPKMDGRAVLAELKEDTLLRLIPVVVLTTSGAKEDIAHAYALHANSYITKPVDFAEFTRRISSLVTYWFDVVSLPTR